LPSFQFSPRKVALPVHPLRPESSRKMEKKRERKENRRKRK
jgi:hypothetical protein